MKTPKIRSGYIEERWGIWNSSDEVLVGGSNPVLYATRKEATDRLKRTVYSEGGTVIKVELIYSI